MTKGYLLRMPLKLKETIAARAKEMGISVHAFILQVLWAYIKEA